MNPDSIKVLFDANWIVISFLIGVVWKYLPALKKLTNTAIPWVSMVGYVLTNLAGVGTANAAGFNFGGVVPDVVGVLIGGFTNAVWARQLYEGFGRSLLEGVFKLKKPA